MNETVIQEIANQLGLAVDQAGQFISTYLPQFAAVQVIQLTTHIITCAVFFILFLIPAIISIWITYKHRKSDIEGDNERRYSKYRSNENWDSYNSFCWFSTFAAIAGFCLITLILVSAFHVPQIIGWSNYPEAMLIQMALGNL